MDTGKVSDEFGHIPEYRGVTGTPRGLNGPTWALVGERGGGQEEARAPKPNLSWEGAGPSFLLSLFLFLPLLVGLGKGETYS